MKTGFIAILGCPNVGKSTLLNAMLGEKIAIVSKKPQTTRTRITGILTRGEEQFLMEVKGCTLEADGIGYFPDAPTERGEKHLCELTKATKDGYKAMLAFVIQMDGVSEVRPNIKTHPEFGTALAEAKATGVEVLFLKCHVEPDLLEII